MPKKAAKRRTGVKRKISKAPARTAGSPTRRPAKKRRVKKRKVKRATGARSRFSQAARARAANPMLAQLKKPPNAYFLFTKKQRPEVMERMGLSNKPADWGALAQELGRMFRELPAAEKEQYEQWAREGKKRDAFLRKVLELGPTIPADHVPELLRDIELEGSEWGAGLDHANTLAIFLVVLTRSPWHSRKAFVDSGGLALAQKLLSAAADSLGGNGNEDEMPADAAPDMVLTALSLLRELPMTKETLRTTAGLAPAAKKLKDLLKAGLPDKVTEGMLRTALQEVIDMWHRVQLGQPGVLPPAPAPVAAAPRERGPKIMNASRASKPSASAAPPPAINFDGNKKAVELDLRRKVVEKLGSHIGDDALSKRIEKCLNLAVPDSTEYKQKARALIYNLGHPGNGALRQRLASGEVDLAALVALDPAALSRELAPPEVAEARAEAEKEGFNRVVDKSGGGVMVWDKASGSMRMRTLAPRGPELRHSPKTPATPATSSPDVLLSRLMFKVNAVAPGEDDDE